VACHLLACWTNFFDPEDGGDMFLRNVGWNSTDYTASYPRRWYSSKIRFSCTCLLPASNWPVCCTDSYWTVRWYWPVCCTDSYWTVRWWGNASGQWKQKCLNSLAWPAAVQLTCQATSWCVYTGTVPGIQLLDTSHRVNGPWVSVVSVSFIPQRIWIEDIEQSSSQR
jgi:hypothetical protein